MQHDFGERGGEPEESNWSAQYASPYAKAHDTVASQRRGLVDRFQQPVRLEWDPPRFATT